MKLKVTTKINERQSVEVEIEGKMDVCLRGANALMAFDGKCGLCNNPNVSLQTKMAKGFSFIEYVCPKCFAKAQWGSYKEGGYFLKKWEQYQAHGEQAQKTPEEPSIDVGAGGEEPIPF